MTIIDYYYPESMCVCIKIFMVRIVSAAFIMFSVVLIVTIHV